MGWLKLIAVAMLVWGNLASADLPTAADNDPQQKLHTIQSWLAYFHKAHPQLEVKPKYQFNSGVIMDLTLKDMQSLYNSMQGQESVPDNGLITISCKQALCDQDGASGT